MLLAHAQREVQALTAAAGQGPESSAPAPRLGPLQSMLNHREGLEVLLARPYGPLDRFVPSHMFIEARRESTVVAVELRALGVGRAVGAFGQGDAQHGVPAADAPRAPLARTLVIAGAEPGPSDGVADLGEDCRRLRAQLGQDGEGTAQHVQLALVVGESSFSAPVRLLVALCDGVEVPQQPAQAPQRVRLQPGLQDMRQPAGLGPHARGEAAQDALRGVARHQPVEHDPSIATAQVRGDAADTAALAAQRLLNCGCGYVIGPPRSCGGSGTSAAAR